METKKLEDAILEIISKIFENNGKEQSYEKIKRLSKKCVEMVTRQVNFIVQEYFSDDSTEQLDLNNSLLVKKHLQKIDNTLNSYFSNQEFLDNALGQNLNQKNDTKILEKLIQKLESMKDYQPDFVLNIRDISLDAWKDTAEFEKILNIERKKFESFVMKLDNKWRNRLEFVKQKTGQKIEKLEIFIKKTVFDANLSCERLLMKIEDLCSKIIKQNSDSEEITNIIKKSGYKDIKGIIKNISKFDGMKNRLQGQNETAQKELKNIKGKISAAINKQEEYKKKFENSEEIFKELEKIFLKMMEFSNFNTNEKKNIEALLTEKKIGIISDLLKNKEDKHLRNNSTVLIKNESEYNSFTTRKNSKPLLNPQIHKSPSKNNVEEPFLSQTDLIATEKTEENSLIPTENSQHKTEKSLNNENTSKKSFENIKENSNVKNETKKILKKENNFSLKKKINTEVVDSKSSQNNVIKSNSKQKYLSEAFSNKKEFETSKNEKIGLINKNKFTNKHRKSLEPQSFIEKEENSLTQSQKISYFSKTEEHSISSLIKKIFANYITKMWKNQEFLKENNENLQVINEMNTEELLKIQIKINGEVKTLQEIFLENIEGSLKTEKNSVLWESIFSTKNNKKNDSRLELNQSSPNSLIKPSEENSKNFDTKGWRKLTLSLFVLLETYLEILENYQDLTIQELLNEKLKNSEKDCIVSHILASKTPENELKEISLIMSRSTKYELLYKIHKINKNFPYAEWKSEKVHIINKIRWGNLINKIKIQKYQEIEKNSNNIKNIAIEMKRNKHDLSVVETTEVIKKTRHNHSMENIALNELKTSHQRNVSFNQRGLNYFLPQIQKPHGFLIKNPEFQIFRQIFG